MVDGKWFCKDFRSGNLREWWCRLKSSIPSKDSGLQCVAASTLLDTHHLLTSAATVMLLLSGSIFGEVLSCIQLYARSGRIPRVQSYTDC